MSFLPSLRGIFKRRKREKTRGENQREASGGDTPMLDALSPEANIKKDSSKPVPLGMAPVPTFPSSSQTHALPSPEQSKIETPSANRDAWINLTAFLDILNRASIFSPLASAVDNLNWFITVHENIVITQDEYDTLRTQLEALFKDLCLHFSAAGDISLTMTASMLNLCGAIQTELKKVYNTQDRSLISRYMQANYDLDKITGCYRRIHGHLERVMFNTSLDTLKIVNKQATDAQLRNLSPSMSACFDSAEANLVQRRECAPKTREQVLLDLEAWKDDPDAEKVCWMNGMAGTGKTTIATSLCSTLKKIHELGASFFCTRSIPACRDVKLILPTIAYQLARFSSPFRGALLQVLDRDPDVHTKVPRVQFERMILEPLQASLRSLPRIVVVIDALDECDDGNGVEQILEVLLEYGSALPIKFLVSSRPEHHIRERIGKSTSKRQFILHELDDRVVQADIETYLRAELNSLSVPIPQDQLAILVERAGVLFIYAATVVRYLKHGNAKARLATVLEIPDAGQGSTNQMREIDQLYETVLMSAFDNEHLDPNEKAEIGVVLHTVVCAQEPLTVDALAGLLGLPPVQVSDALKPLWSVLHLSEFDPSHRVSTLHASFPDYMLDPNRAKRFAFNARICNGKLAESCFFRIGQNITQFNLCNLKSSHVFDEDVLDLDERVKQNIPLDLLYACQYWAVHLFRGEEQNKQAEALHEFLSSRLLLWMEVLNLNNRINQAIGQIETAIAWLETTKLSEKSISLARDALRFVTLFATSPVSQSTPHLYVSMLSSWPHYQPVSKCYTRKTTELVKAKGIETTERQLSLLSLIPAGSHIYCVAYSSNGAFIAAGTDDKAVPIWDAVSCRMITDPNRGSTGGIPDIAISPDGAQICSASFDCTLRISDPQCSYSRSIAGPPEGHTSAFLSVHYSPNGRYLASGSLDGTVRIWDTHNWEVNGDPLNGNDGRVFSVAFSPDSSFVASGSKSLIHLWDHLSGQMIGDPLKGHTDYILTLAFTPDGKHLISGSCDRTIFIWDINTGRAAFGPLQGHLSAVYSVAVSPNGQLLVSTALDDTIRIWDVKNWTTCSVLRHTGVAKSVVFSPDGSRLVSGSVDGNIRVWEVPDASGEIGVETKPQWHRGAIRSLAFSPCGAYIVSGSYDMTVRVWDAQSGQPRCDPLIGHNDWVTRVGVSSDSNHIFSVSRDRMILVWDAKTGQREYTIGPIETDGDYDLWYQEFWPAAFLFDERRVVCGSKSGRIHMWENDKLVKELTGHSHAVYSVAFSPNGQSFVSGDDAGNLILWDASSGERLLGPFNAHSSIIYSVAFSPDGSLVASSSEDRAISLWNTNTGAQVGSPLRGHTNSAYSVAFSPQGTQLVSGSQDMTIRIWDVTRGESIAILEGHTGWVAPVAFSPDGTRIVSGSGDKTIRIWKAPMLDEHMGGDSCSEHTIEPADTPKHARALSWTMDENGWVKDRERRLLLWVPPDIRSVLVRPRNTMLISGEGRVEFDFTDARIGDAWTMCYEPFPPATAS